MNTAHTPGPWVSYHSPRDTLVSVNTLDGKDVGGAWTTTWDRHERGVNEVVLANARLMAAAPEMLAVLKMAVEHDCLDGDPLVLDEARAAIAKATGDAQ